jgi:hypothetical protein
VTRREAEVLAALAERLTNAEIAARLYVSERTVESHVASLLRKLEAPNRLVLGDMAKEVLKTPPSLPPALELLADPPGYVGRSDELGGLRALWSRSAAGQMLFCVVSGEAGIGKSRLVAEIAIEVHQAGARVLLGSCFEDMALPYLPFVQALTDDMDGLPDEEARRRVGPAAEALARIVPDVARRLSMPARTDVLDLESARVDVASGLHGYLSRAAEAQPILLVIEDAHWATPTTLGALRHLARVGGHAPVLVLVTTRDAAPDLHDALKVFLGDLARLPTVERIELGGLHADDVATLLDRLGASADPAAVVAETGGNPLFVREVARSSNGGVGGSLGSLLSRRYALLDKEDLALLDVASVIGSEFDAELVGITSSRTVAEVLDSLERAEDAGLIAPPRAVPAISHSFMRCSETPDTTRYRPAGAWSSTETWPARSSLAPRTRESCRSYPATRASRHRSVASSLRSNTPEQPPRSPSDLSRSRRRPGTIGKPWRLRTSSHHRTPALASSS